MAFIGTPLDTRNTFQSLVGKSFNGDGSETDFTLDVAPSSTLDIEVFVGNVRQDPNSAYTLSGTTLTFTGAPPSGTNNIYVVHQAKSVGTIDPPATETIAKTFSGGLTSSGATTVSGALVASSTVRVGSGTTSAQANGDDVVIEGSANTGLTILSGADDLASVYLGQNGANNDCKFEYDNDTNALVVHTNATLAMTINGSGAMTKPKQPCFFAYASTQSGIGSGTYDVIFANERFDLGGNFATPSFTAPVTGKYAFQMSVLLVNLQAGGNASVYFQVSNAEIRVWRQDTDGDAGTYETASGAIVIDMDANDTCKIQVNSSVDNDYIIDGGAYSTHFSGYLVA